MLNNPQMNQARDTNFQRSGESSRSPGMTMPGGGRETESSSATKRKTSGSSPSGTQAAAAAGTTASAPTHDEIAARAFQVYVRKGRPEGRDTENWLEAEAELRRERSGKSAKR